MKLTWLTDIHLNFLEIDEREKFYQEILENKSDVVLITGDIAEANSLVTLLTEMADHIKKSIYFVLGNHDYYRGQVSEVRKAASALTQSNDYLFWLPASGVQVLNDSTLIVGQDGWADGRIGDYENSTVSLNDSRMIADLFQAKMLGKKPLLEKMQELADADAFNMSNNLVQAISRHPKTIIILTHVPPFKESCQHEGKISDNNWLPYFSSKIMGEVLLRAAEENPSIHFQVFCGHTHSESSHQPLHNLTIKAGKAEYYRPTTQELIIV